MGHAIRCTHLPTKHVPRSSNTPIDYKVQMQHTKIRQESGKQLVALNRDGVTHGFDSHMKDAFIKVYDDGTTMPKWPYTIKETVDVLEINLPKYLPMLARLLIKFIKDFDLGKFCCWPRDGNCDCLAVLLNTVSNGQHAKLLKFGYTKLVLRLITKKVKGMAATNPRRQALKVR